MRIGFVALPWVLVAAALAVSGCGPSDEAGDDDGGGSDSGGVGGAHAGVGSAAGTLAAGGRGGAPATGGAAALAGRGGAGGSAGKAGGAGEAAKAGEGGRLGAGGRAGAAGGDAVAGAGGRAASGGDAGAGGDDAGGAAGGPDASGVCASPFETVDISELVTTETQDPYWIMGTTAGELRQSINTKRPYDYDAYTSWYLSYRFEDCWGAGLVVTADVTYTVPAWDPPSDASPALVESWDKYMNALFCHEYDHARHGLEAGNDVYAALSDIHVSGDCTLQNTLAQQAFDAVIAEYNQRDIDYDAETMHGATMGATFPLP